MITAHSRWVFQLGISDTVVKKIDPVKSMTGFGPEIF